MALSLYIAEDTVIQLDGLKDDLTDEYLDDAELTMAVVAPSGEVVAEDLPLSYVPESDGVYQGVVPGSTPLTRGCRYTVLVTGTAGGAPVYRREIAVAREH